MSKRACVLMLFVSLAITHAAAIPGNPPRLLV